MSLPKLLRTACNTPQTESARHCESGLVRRVPYRQHIASKRNALEKRRNIPKARGDSSLLRSPQDDKKKLWLVWAVLSVQRAGGGGWRGTPGAPVSTRTPSMPRETPGARSSNPVGAQDPRELDQTSCQSENRGAVSGRAEGDGAAVGGRAERMLSGPWNRHHPAPQHLASSEDREQMTNSLSTGVSTAGANRLSYVGAQPARAIGWGMPGAIDSFAARGMSGSSADPRISPHGHFPQFVPPHPGFVSS